MLNKIMSKLNGGLCYDGMQGRKHVFRRGMSKFLFSEEELVILVKASCKVLRKSEESKRGNVSKPSV